MYWLKNSRLNIYIRCHSHQYYLIECLILFSMFRWSFLYWRCLLLWFL